MTGMPTHLVRELNVGTVSYSILMALIVTHSFLYQAKRATLFEIKASLTKYVKGKRSL